MEVFPEDWDVVKLGECLKLGHGRDYKHLGCGDIPVYGTGGKMTMVNEWLHEGPSVCIGRKGTIDEPQYHEGKIWTVDTLFYTHSFKGVDPKFIYYKFLTIDWLSYNAASGVPSLTANTIESIVVHLPPLPEQRRIAAALGDMDKLIDNISKRIEKKKAIKQGSMQELLTGKKRLPGFEGEWKKVKLGEITDIRTGKRNGDEQKPNGLYPFFVRSQVVYRIDSYSYDGEAIIIPGEGGIGTIFHYINGKFDFHQRVYKISDFPEDVVCKYVYYYMKYFFGRYALQNTVKATVDSLRLPTFQSFDVYMPPSLAEQRAIAKVLGDMDAEIAKLEAKREKLIGVKKGMMSDLLTGKVRLKTEME